MKPASTRTWCQSGAVLLLVLSAASGCSNSGMESRVAGTIKLDGQAVGPGVAMFMPPDGKSNPAQGAIQPNGSYFLKTNREEGLHAGAYKVSVMVLDQPPVNPGERSNVPAKLVTPKKYSDPATSGLEYTVKPGKNTIDIELSSK
jgi:hypothetical protein